MALGFCQEIFYILNLKTETKPSIFQSFYRNQIQKTGWQNPLITEGYKLLRSK